MKESLEMPNMFLNDDEIKLVRAICSRIIPSDPNSPGAEEAKAFVYIDNALGGYFSHLQKFYRQRLQDVNDLSNKLYGKEFIELETDQQDELLLKMEKADLGEYTEHMKLFFEVIYEHTIEGTFGDPKYGGNYGFSGWKLIGFPGAQWGYTGEQMNSNFDSKEIEVLSVSDLLSREII
jgi:gluconate 2-dehydrogenase gamma chain